MREQNSLHIYMKHSLRTGICFGLTSGIITTLGLMAGLHSSTNSKLIVIGGILTIAIADSFSDALGIHIAEEAKHNGNKEIWESTAATFIAKLVVALTFMIPVFMFALDKAIAVSIIWGVFCLCVLSYIIAKSKGENPIHVIVEHAAIALLVVAATHCAGDLIADKFSI